MAALHPKTEIAWAAGFFDGEGCIHLTDRKKKYQYALLSIAQAGEDKELLLRFQAAIGGYGKIYNKHNKNSNASPTYQLHVAKQEEVWEVIKKLSPYLSSVKIKQAEAVKSQVKYGPILGRIAP